MRYSYVIKGLVQGVGFRPFIYKLAIDFKLIGFVQNNLNGVYIEVEGKETELEKFDNQLKYNLPVLARIDYINKNKIKSLYKGQFEIIHSEFTSLVSQKTASISPDMAICSKCKSDIRNNLKYKNYFATNCTNCGPRYSIIQAVPYDRIYTSMNKFKMCNSCYMDYSDPLNRRYHAQPISCTACGPELLLYTKYGKVDSSIDKLYENISSFIKIGMIGAIKGLGGFHIVCNAIDTKVIKKLRRYKRRETKPFAIMCRDIDMIKEFANVNKIEEKVLLSKEAPIVLLNSKINSIIAPNMNRIGCMLPYTALHSLFFDYFKNPIIVTSANLGGEPIIITKEDIELKLPFIDFVVDYNRDIVNSIDDSVVQVVDDDIQILRLSRGYAPKEIKLPFKLDKNILALGANQKSTISLAFDDKIILSPYIGDLNNLKSIEALNRTIETFKRFYDFEPDLIVCDKHPQYETTRIAKQLEQKGIELIQVQHHLSHLYSVKAEYNLQGKNYVGFVFDGTGFGDDKTLWGGEVFVNEKRKYHFKSIKLLGGEKAIKECKRVALSLLFEFYSLDEIFNLDLPTINSFTKNEIKILYNMWEKGLNTPESSSVGRLFDAIASLNGICQIQTYEGEAGLLCEMKYDNNFINSFDYNLNNNIIDIKFNFLDTHIVSKFINTLVKIIIDISKKEDLPILLSGGVFQNKILLELIIQQCKVQNIKYYYNKYIPINDSGISVGQIWNYIL